MNDDTKKWGERGFRKPVGPAPEGGTPGPIPPNFAEMLGDFMAQETILPEGDWQRQIHLSPADGSDAVHALNAFVGFLSRRFGVYASGPRQEAQAVHELALFAVHLNAKPSRKAAPQKPAGFLAGFPRRIQVEQWCPAEHAISDAMRVVEAMGADVRLTDAVDMLGKARDRVADFIDGVQRAAPQPSGDAVESGSMAATVGVAQWSAAEIAAQFWKDEVLPESEVPSQDDIDLLVRFLAWVRERFGAAPPLGEAPPPCPDCGQPMMDGKEAWFCALNHRAIYIDKRVKPNIAGGYAGIQRAAPSSGVAPE